MLLDFLLVKCNISKKVMEMKIEKQTMNAVVCTSTDTDTHTQPPMASMLRHFIQVLITNNIWETKQHIPLTAVLLIRYYLWIPIPKT